MPNITVIGKSNCGYCTKAKLQLNMAQLAFKYMSIDGELGEGNISQEDVVSLFPGVRSVPIIVVDGKNIGGYNELVAYLNTLDKRDLLLG